MDPQVHPDRGAGGEVWCVLEEFTGPGPTDVRRVLAAVPLDGSAADDRSAVRELSDGGHRFVTGPKVSHDGRRAAWIAWDHPRMPWDGTVVMLAEITDAGEFTGVRPLVGDVDESVCQVEWDRDGSLLFVSDLVELVGAPAHPPRRRGRGRGAQQPPSAAPGRGVRRAAVEDRAALVPPLENGLIAVLHGRGSQRLGILDPETGELADVPGHWTSWSDTLTVHGSRVFGVAASPRTGPEVVELDTATGRTRVIGFAHRDAVDPAYCSVPQDRTFTGPDGREIHAHIHPPHSPDRTGPEGELPPYVVWAHGGPTGHAPLVLDLETAYFTSRGIGVAVVNYGGSTGYGRHYRERLREQWGVVDVADCAAVADALVAEGAADPHAARGPGRQRGRLDRRRLAHRHRPLRLRDDSLPRPGPGGLVDEAGTHDFESQYLESLIGPAAEVPERYRERAPINRTDRLTTPFLLLQGLDDEVCPSAQCDRFLAAVAGRGVPHAYIAFEGEGHGFRRAETLVRALEAELSLYVQTFGIDRTDVPPLELKK